MNHLFLNRLTVLGPRIPESYVAGIVLVHYANHKSVLQRLTPEMVLLAQDNQDTKQIETVYLETPKGMMELVFAKGIPPCLRTGMVIGILANPCDSKWLVTEWVFPCKQWCQEPGDVRIGAILSSAVQSTSAVSVIKQLVQSQTLTHLVVCGYVADEYLCGLCSVVPVWCMPIPQEHYSNRQMPQKAMHPRLFPRSMQTGALTCSPNPFILASCFLFCSLENPKQALDCSHLLPDPREYPGSMVTPSQSQDPLVIIQHPCHVFNVHPRNLSQIDLPNITNLESVEMVIWNQGYISRLAL